MRQRTARTSHGFEVSSKPVSSEMPDTRSGIASSTNRLCAFQLLPQLTDKRDNLEDS